VSPPLSFVLLHVEGRLLRTTNSSWGSLCRAQQNDPLRSFTSSGSGHRIRTLALCALTATLIAGCGKKDEPVVQVEKKEVTKDLVKSVAAPTIEQTKAIAEEGFIYGLPLPLPRRNRLIASTAHAPFNATAERCSHARIDRRDPPAIRLWELRDPRSAANIRGFWQPSTRGTCVGAAGKPGLHRNDRGCARLSPRIGARPRDSRPVSRPDQSNSIRI
jgi:hypothetical protein